MTREALADRLVNYADAIAAFSVVNGIAFLIALTETEIRCSLSDLQWFVVGGQVSFGLIITLGVVALRRLELNLRASMPPLQSDVAAHLRGFFYARLVVIVAATILIVVFGLMALTDPSCLPTEPS